jgi:chloramphenicol 3-O-phosphotransferase
LAELGARASAGHELVVVLAGPIASGKSTVARAVAVLFQQQGLSAAAIDLDLLYEMLDPAGAPKSDDAIWRRARRASGALTNALLADGHDAVVVEGGFLGEQARSDFTGVLRGSIRPLFVALEAPLAVALTRAQADPTRGVSRDPAFLRAHYEEVTAVLEQARETDLVLDTSLFQVDAAARAIVSAALDLL